MFGRREINDPARLLRLHGDHWRQGEILRVTPKRRWNADPSAKNMVLRRRDLGELALTPMRWGLIPDWTRPEFVRDEGRPLVSVRAETFREEIEWRRLLNTHRCVVPADQFFEWKRVDGMKTKEYAFRLKDRRPMMIAGIWNRTPAPGGRTLDGFAYVSCPANHLFSFVHDRMPVILDEAGVSKWFNPDATLESLLGLMRPMTWGGLELSAVGQPAKAKPYHPSLFASRAA